MPEIKGDYQGRLKTIKCTADAKLETVGMIEAGTISEVGRVGTVGDIEHLGSIANTKFNQGSLDDHDRWIKGDDVGTKRYVKVDSDGKLQTVSLLDAGTSVIGSIDRVATVGQSETYIKQDGTWVELRGQANSAFTAPGADRAGVLYNLRCNRDRDLVTAPGWTGTRRVKLLTDDDWRLKLATLGTVEHVNEIDHLGTIGDINHLGSIGNTSFDQGAVSDHERHMHIKQYGTWAFLQGTSNCAYVEALVEHNNALVHLESCNMGGLITSPGWDGALHVPLETDDFRRLKTAPATTRESGQKTVLHAGTAVALVLNPTPCISVIVKARHSNVGEIYVGGSAVSSATGYPLRKDEFVSFSCDNVNGVYIDRDAGTQGVSFLYVNY